MSKPVTIAALDATHFTLNGRSVPRVFLALAADDRDALIVNSADDEVTYDVPLGSTVAGATPTSQAALIAALAPVVGGVGGAAAGGGGGGGGGGDASAANQVLLLGKFLALDSAASATQSALPVGGVRLDADTSPVSADGDAHPFVFGPTGRLKVSAVPAELADTTGNITAVGQSVSAGVSRASNVVIYVTGTFAGVNLTFEASIDDGASWFAVQAVRSNANTVELVTGVLSAAPAYAWELSVNAYSNVRTRATAWTSGTAVVRIRPGAYATEPIIATQTTTVTGTVTANLGAGGTAATSLGKARDGASAATDTAVPAMFIRRDTPTALTPIAGDYEVAQIDSTGSQWVHPVMGTTGGATPYTLVSAATTNATSVKASVGTVTSIVATNNHATNVAYLKLYNKASAPTVGTDTPVAVYMLAPAGGLSLTLPTGMAFATGLALAITGGAAHADATAVAVSQVNVNLTYH